MPHPEPPDVPPDLPPGADLIRPYGERALLVEAADLTAVLALAAALRASPPPGLIDLVPAARTVLLTLRPGTRLTAVREHLAGLGGSAVDTPVRDPVVIEVVYDGPDLAEVAAATGLRAEEVVAVHTGRSWTVAFTGFSPGFAYLSGGDPRLRVARRAVPRTRVPAGSVGLAGEYSGVYPASTPGGWQLIGRTTQTMWEPTRDRPALLEPGMTVRFTAAGEPPRPPLAQSPQRPPPGHRPDPDRPSGRQTDTVAPAALEILAAGPRCSIQDAGRPGYANLGVSPSGAADRGAWARANRLVGNPAGSAAIEATLGGLTVRSPVRRTVAITGASVAADVDGRPVAMDAAITLPGGGVLRLGRPQRGLRTYVAVRGGIDVPAVLGSRSLDELSGLGPPPLAPGDRLAVGALLGQIPGTDIAPQPAAAADLVLHCHPGPRADWLTPAALATLTSVRWTATDQLDRIGVRLAGPRLAWRGPAELPSEGIVRGAVQVPPSGQPLVFLADHPTTGGYPVVAVITDADADRLAQIRPGQSVRLRRAAPLS